MSHTAEPELGEAVLRIMATEPNGRATVRKIKREVPNYVRLVGNDQADSLTRSGEELWEQRVRNLKSHDKTPGNIFHDGYATHVARGVWAITDAGRIHIGV